MRRGTPVAAEPRGDQAPAPGLRAESPGACLSPGWGGGAGLCPERAKGPPGRPHGRALESPVSTCCRAGSASVWHEGAGDSVARGRGVAGVCKAVCVSFSPRVTVFVLLTAFVFGRSGGKARGGPAPCPASGCCPLVAGPRRDQGGPREADPVWHQGAEPERSCHRGLAAALSACVPRSPRD